MARWDTIAIVGVGLIGGSIGLAVQDRGLARRVVGVGRRLSSLRKAKRHGTVSTTTTDLAGGVCDAELIIVCTPVADIVTRVGAVAKSCRHGALITDVGSTKAEIVSSVEATLDQRSTFVGSHPMAGSDRGGAENARPDLFQGRVTVVTATPRTPRDAEQTIAEFWEALGSTVVRMTPSAHDHAVAMISHATHVIASSLAAATDPAELVLAATGWSDTTRVAAADPELWRQILMSNRDAVLQSLDKFEKVLSTFRAALQCSDEARIVQLLEMGKQTRDALGS